MSNVIINYMFGKFARLKDKVRILRKRNLTGREPRGINRITRLDIKAPSPRPYRQGIAVVLIVRNEERHVGEWALFHLLAGVRHFYVYDDNCNDATIVNLRRAVPATQLTVIPWGQRLQLATSPSPIHNQVLAYAHAASNFGGEYRWMAFIDADEFMVPRIANTLDEALAPYESVSQIRLPWAMFGRCGYDTAPKGGVIENYAARARDLFDNTSVKYKIILDATQLQTVAVHAPDTNGSYIVLDKMDSPIQLNHYYSRSNEELEAKISRSSNYPIEAEAHRKRVMRRVTAIEADTEQDSTAMDYLARQGVTLPLNPENA